MKKKSRIISSVFLLLTLILLLFAIPQNIPPFQIPVINSQINLSPASNIMSNPTLQPLGINISANFGYKLGLDLQGGAQLLYELDMSEIEESERQNALEAARSTIERRVNIFGVAEPEIQTISSQDTFRIQVELPGATDVDEATDLIGRTAQLEFWEEGGEDAKIATEEAGLYPFGAPQILNNAPVETNLTGKDLDATSVVFNPNTGEPQVQLSFTSQGAQKFADITKRNVGKPVAIVLDNFVIQAPVVQQVITQGTAVISGGFTPESARNLSIALNSGALPAPLSIVEQRTVGPTLGMESLMKSLVAGAIGLVAVLFYMIAQYRKEGLVASFALIFYTVLVLSIIKVLGITLTLAGIAGLILSVGMAVDANILIFERLKEELRLGKKRTVALRLGFDRAWTSIRDSNVTSLITVFILFFFGTGIIRGFAITLGIGILVSMFTAITVTKTALRAIEKES